MAFISNQWLKSRGFSDRKHSPVKVGLSACSPNPAWSNVVLSPEAQAVVEVTLWRDGEEDDYDDPDFKTLYLSVDEALTIATAALERVTHEQFILALSKLLAKREAHG